MSEQKHSGQRSAPIFGILLLFLGTVFLLQNLDILPWGLWGVLWRLWPILLISLGLKILLRRFHPWLVSALILALFCAGVGVAIWQYPLP